MARFFTALNTYKMLEKWASVLDWLLNDGRFAKTNGWSSDKVRAFTNRSKKTFKKENWIIGSQENLNWEKIKANEPFIQMTSDDSIGRSLI